MADEQIQTAIDPIIIFPTWETSVWNALQDKNYKLAAENLQKTLEYFTDEGLEYVFWGGIIEGVPSVLGSLSREEWKNDFLPLFAQVFLNFTDGKRLSVVYENTDINSVIEFNKYFCDGIPGEIIIEKLQTLKTFQSTLYVYLVGSPTQAIGIQAIEIKKKIETEKDPVNQYKVITETLKNVLFSYETANGIYLIGEKNKLSDEQISNIAYITGLVLLGLLEDSELNEKIAENLGIDQKTADFISNNIRETILNEHKDEIYRAIESAKQNEEVKKEIYLDVFGTENTNEIKLPIKNIQKTEEDDKSKIENAPLIIHREKPTTPTTEISSKGFSSLPFGFFKPKTNDQKDFESAVKAKIESPKENKEKIVDYSELRTNLTPFAKRNDMIPTEPFAKQEISKIEPQIKPTELKQTTVENEIKQPETRVETKTQSWGFFKKQNTPIETNKTDVISKKIDYTEPVKKIEPVEIKKTIQTPENNDLQKRSWFLKPFNKKTSATAPDTDKKTEESQKTNNKGTTTIEGNIIDLRK